MKTLAKVGATSNILWWAINGVSLLFAVANAAQRCARTHIQTWFCWLSCTYSLPWILVKSVNVCFDFCTWKQKQICIAYLYIISIWFINMFLLYFICNFCQQVDCMQYNHVSGKLLAKREIWQWDKDCHVKSLTIPNLYFLNELIDRYA